MSEYHISRIFYNDRREMKKLDALLEKEGIERDDNLDYTIGLYDDDYNLAATGSCFANTLRCMAVDSGHQGEGLLNQVVSHLIQYESEQGTVNLFLYTKYDKALFFRDLGFYEVARADGRVVFMENRKNGFASYLDNLYQETQEQVQQSDAQPEAGLPVGAVVMNANPFTLGHLYLLATAAAACRLLHVFIVSEDASLVPFDVRYNLVKEGSAHLKNLVFHQTGSYLISNATFPSYFLKDKDTVIRTHAKLDTAIFGQIAKSLDITVRYVGEEPASQVTGIYNEIMAAELPLSGVECRIIPRRTAASGVISASTVRRKIHEGRLEEIRERVPESTLRYFLSEEAGEVVKRIQESSQVTHY